MCFIRQFALWESLSYRVKNAPRKSFFVVNGISDDIEKSLKVGYTRMKKIYMKKITKEEKKCL